jgi:hypothetical protein
MTYHDQALVDELLHTAGRMNLQQLAMVTWRRRSREMLSPETFAALDDALNVSPLGRMVTELDQFDLGEEAASAVTELFLATVAMTDAGRDYRDATIAMVEAGMSGPAPPDLIARANAASALAVSSRERMEVALARVRALGVVPAP